MYPHAAAPSQGVFVENRLRALVAHGGARSLVLAPVPWFPSTAHRFGAWARHAAAPPHEWRHGLEVLHPRFPAVPRIGMNLAPWLLYEAAKRALGKLLEAGRRFDLIDAHYLYPDGVAAIWLGRRFGLPVVLTARGSDVTQLPYHALPRFLIQRAAGQADALISVSAGLRTALGSIGVPPDRVTVLRNGVDLVQFRPLDRLAARAELGLSGPTLLSVGGLIARKGHDLTIAALVRLPEWTLLIAGEGPERGTLLSLAERLGVAARVRLLGNCPHDTLAPLYNAAECSVLASAREGWANVLLESMACGTPVVASPIAGNDEVVRAPAAGLLMATRTSDALAAAVTRLQAGPPDRGATRAYAEQFGWDAVSAGQMTLFRQVLAKRAA